MGILEECVYVFTISGQTAKRLLVRVPFFYLSVSSVYDHLVLLSNFSSHFIIKDIKKDYCNKYQQKI